MPTFINYLVMREMLRNGLKLIKHASFYLLDFSNGMIPTCLSLAKMKSLEGLWLITKYLVFYHFVMVTYVVGSLVGKRLP